jgi:hypothetical protein
MRVDWRLGWLSVSLFVSPSDPLRDFLELVEGGNAGKSRKLLDREVAHFNTLYIQIRTPRI